MISCLNICFAYAGNQGFVTVMAEMKDPGKDFVPSLLYLQTFAIVIYTVVGAVIYSFAGQYTTSPALGAAPVVPAKIAYGVVFPCLLGTGFVFGHTAIKYMFVETMKMMKATDELTSNTRRAWNVWILSGTIFWIVAFVPANSIPAFRSILSVSSAIFVAWFTFGISGAIWVHLNWGRQFVNKRKAALAALNWIIIAIALMNTGGIYAALKGLLNVFNDPKVNINGPFTCEDNGIF
jgi:hypothetical protein